MTDQRWDHLCLQQAAVQPVAEALRAVLTQHGYAAYDPFPGGSGTPPRYKQFVRLLIMPTAVGWVRVFGAQDAATLPDLLAALSADRLLIHAWFTATTCGLDAYQGGSANAEHLAPYLTASAATQATTRTASTLPPDLADLAQSHGVNPKQAEKMVGRLARGIFGKQTASVQQEAGNLFKSPWESSGGQQLIVLLARLALPFTLRDPDFETLREAYQAARMLARRPTATLLDSERSALRALPNAGNILPVYVGK
ncbi:hypothetical protein FBQ95_11410 [Chloroflexi bacterium CFX3]|nr:hypothetical protein [Chloroflexi bacterium CFX3]